MWAVDLFASEYGWTKDYIYYHVYLDELFILMARIEERKRNENLLLLAISHNPHSQEPQLLWDALRHSNNDREDETLDVEGFERLKAEMSKNPKIIVK